MDQKSWLWKKRSTEKTLVADKLTNSLSKKGELTEVEKLLSEKTDLERELRISNEKLSSALSECNAKHNVAKKQVKIAEEAIAGWEKAESEAICLKLELDKIVQQKAASDARIGHLDAALKECMQQLRFVREDQEKKLAKLDAENTQLTKALSGKEKVIKDLGKYRTQVEVELKALLLRVESTEKENASLKYEVRVLEKELHIRNEEREVNRRIEENRAQKDALNKKSSELQFSKNMYAYTAPSALTGLEHLNNEKQLGAFSIRNMGSSDMSLMDDFAEMEKLAVVSVDYPAGISHLSSDEGNVIINNSLDLDTADMRNGNSISNTEKSGEKFGSNVSISIYKVLELLEGINAQPQDNCIAEFSSGEDDKISSYKNFGNPTGYIVRVFQWKADELSAILQQFVSTCNELLNGTATLENFVQQVASNLEWIINHCFSLQDVSSMKDAIRNRLDWYESRSESEDDCEPDDHLHPQECNKLQIQKEKVKTWNVEWGIESSSIADSEGYPQSEIIKGECVMIQLQEPKDKNKNNTCKRLEDTCHDLKIQLQSIQSKDVSDNGKPPEKQLQSDWEITMATEKLAECQETILNLGKQLKALASPNDTVLFDKVISATAGSVVTGSSTPGKNLSRRSSLLNKMLAEDNGASHSTKQENENGESYPAFSTNATMDNSTKSTKSNGINQEDKSETVVASMDIVACKKNGGRSFFSKLFWRSKNGTSKANS